MTAVDSSSLQVFLLAGQSNMSGRGNVEEIDSGPFENIYMFNKEEQWVPATHPLHFDKPQRAGVGPGLRFAQTLLEANPDQPIGLVPTAVGGTPLSRWMQDGDLFQEAVRRCKLAARFEQFAGILWLQGERDSREDELTATYAERLTQAIVSFRKELENEALPFIASEIGHFCEEIDTHPNWAQINEALNALQSSTINYSCVSAEGLGHVGDSLHFNTEAAETIGRNMAEVWLDYFANA